MTISRLGFSLIAILLLISIFVVSVRFLSSKSKPILKLGIQENGELQKCPDSPNCVSSFADKNDSIHYISAIKIQEKSWNNIKTKIQNYINTQSRYLFQNESENYLYYTQKSATFGFIDDVEFLFIPEKNELHFRSSSRIGYGDMGVNRQRIEEVKEFLKEG